MTSFVLGAACAEIASYSAQTSATALVAGQPLVVPVKPGLNEQCDNGGNWWSHEGAPIAMLTGQSASAVSPSSVKLEGGMCGGTITITGGVGAGGVTILGPLSLGAKIVINGDVAGDLVVGTSMSSDASITVTGTVRGAIMYTGSMSSGASITVTGAVQGVIKKTGSMSSDAKIEAGSCPAGITPVHDISSGAQIICAGQVRFGA